MENEKLPKEILIQKAWLESLMRHVDSVEKSKKDGYKYDNFAVALLVGYASSAEFILDTNPNQSKV